MRVATAILQLALTLLVGSATAPVVAQQPGTGARQSVQRIDELLKKGDADSAARRFASARQAYAAALGLLGPSGSVADRREIGLRLARGHIARGAPKDALHVLNANAAAFVAEAAAHQLDALLEIREPVATSLGDATRSGHWRGQLQPSLRCALRLRTALSFI